MKPFFSILVPVYNQVGLMDECVRSLKEQTFSDYEVIMVDDGSTDDSYNMLMGFSKADGRIKVKRHEKNQSLLAARFTGMEAAEGEYVVFLDSDDFLENFALEKLHALLIENPVDVVRFGYILDPIDRKDLPPECDDLLKGMLNQVFPPAIWKNCFKNEVVKKAIKEAEPFYCNMGEDSFMSTMLYLHSNTSAVLNEYLYHYNVGVGMSACTQTIPVPKFKTGLKSIVASGEHILELVKKLRPELVQETEFALKTMRRYVYLQAFMNEKNLSNCVKLIGAVSELGLEEDVEELSNNTLVAKIFESKNYFDNVIPDISVIIPMYNSQEYIRIAVDSVLNQTKKEVEILLVDDCSTDNSAQICEEYYKEEKRVRVIRQKKNAGAGMARNTGIKLARGRYIAFLDSDDQYMPEYLQNMYDCAVKHDADVVHSTFWFMPAVDEVPMDMLSIKPSSLAVFGLDNAPEPYREDFVLDCSKEELFVKWLNHEIHWSIWSNLYRRDFLLANGIEFSSMRLAEDHHFVFNCLFNDPKFVILPGGGYVYRLMEKSVSRGEKNADFICNALTAEFEGSRAITRTMEEMPFFAEDPIKKMKIAQFLQDGIEFVFVRLSFWEMGADKVASNAQIYSVFEKYFGDDAAYNFEMFVEAHKFRQPAGEAEIVQCYSPKVMKELLLQKRFKSLEEYQAEKTGEKE